MNSQDSIQLNYLSSMNHNNTRAETAKFISFVTAVLCWGLCFQSAAVVAQCEAGEVALEWAIQTDAWGYEMYWELTPSGVACGDVSFIASNGNSDGVGCDGSGNGGSGGTVYGNNATFMEGPFCVAEGAELDLIHVDSYGDGGSGFQLISDGVIHGMFNGTGYGNTWTFTAGESMFIDHDVPCDAAALEVDGVTVMVANNGGTAQLGEITPPASPGGSCALPGSWCGSDPWVSASVWLSLVPTVSDPITIMACSDSTTYDTQLALYRVEDCADFTTYTLVGSNDDACAGWASIMYTSCLEVGATYLLQLDGWNGQQGTAEITAFTTETPETGLAAQQRNITCPLDKDTTPNGFLLPYLNSGGSDFSCSWTGPNGFTSEDSWITNLSAGIYTANVISSCGTSFTGTYEILVPDNWNISSEVFEASCDMSYDGGLDVEVSGATAPYTFGWTGPDGFTSNEQDLDGILAGTYQLNITDDNGCTQPMVAFVTNTGYDDFSIGNDTIICADEALLLYGPTDLTYEWQDGSVNQFFYINPGDLSPGTYSIVLNAVTDSGCELADALILTVHECSVGMGEIGLADSPLFPNPASQQVFIAIDATDAPWSIFVTDAAGRSVYDGAWFGGQDSPLLDVSEWSAGLYHVRMVNGNRQTVRLLEVNR